jgi:hypothetical protein
VQRAPGRRAVTVTVQRIRISGLMYVIYSYKATPALEELDFEEQRVMLAHELAHLARRDPLWLAFARML